jgi:hypothetical protein
MVDKSIIETLRGNSSQLIKISTVVSTVVVVLRTLNVVDWNLDLALILLSNMNLLAELLLTGGLIVVIILATSNSVIFFSHELGQPIPSSAKFLAATMTILLCWIPLYMVAIYFGAMILRIIMNVIKSKTKTFGDKLSKFVVTNSLGLGASILAGVWVLALPNGLLVPGQIEKFDGSQVQGNLLIASSQVLVVDIDANAVTYVDNSAIRKIETDIEPSKIWSRSIYSHLIHAFQKN